MSAVECEGCGQLTAVQDVSPVRGLCPGCREARYGGAEKHEAPPLFNDGPVPMPGQFRMEDAMSEAEKGPRCETCGRSTRIDCGICGTCAEDWNDRDAAAGLRRINRRRKSNGLPPIQRK